MPFLKKERSKKKKKSDGEHKASGCKMQRRKVDGIECVMKYLAKVMKVDKKLGRFDLSYLENHVLSWSVDDVFNRDLFREKVILDSLVRPLLCVWGGFVVCVCGCVVVVVVCVCVGGGGGGFFLNLVLPPSGGGVG